VTGGDS